MKVYLVKRKKDPSFNDETRWLIIANNDVELFWEIDKYLSPWDVRYYEVKKKSISLEFKVKKLKPEFEDDLDFDIQMNEEGTDGLYDLIDRVDNIPWTEFNKQERNFYERAYDTFIDKAEPEVYCEVCDTSYYPDDTCKLH